MFKRCFSLLAVLVLLSACQSVKKEYRAVVPDRDVAYLDHQVQPELVMPSGLAVQHLQNYYPIPSGPLPAPGSQPIDVTPPGFDRLLTEKKS